MHVQPPRHGWLCLPGHHPANTAVTDLHIGEWGVFVLKVDPAALPPAPGGCAGAGGLREAPAALRCLSLHGSCVGVGQGGNLARVSEEDEALRGHSARGDALTRSPREKGPGSGSGQRRGCSLRSRAGLQQLRWEGAAPRSGAACWHTALPLVPSCQVPLPRHHHLHRQLSQTQDPAVRHPFMASPPLLCIVLLL